MLQLENRSLLWLYLIYYICLYYAQAFPYIQSFDTQTEADSSPPPEVLSQATLLLRLLGLNNDQSNLTLSQDGDPFGLINTFNDHDHLEPKPPQENIQWKVAVIIPLENLDSRSRSQSTPFGTQLIQDLEQPSQIQTMGASAFVPQLLPFGYSVAQSNAKSPATPDLRQNPLTKAHFAEPSDEEPKASQTNFSSKLSVQLSPKKETAEAVYGVNSLQYGANYVSPFSSNGAFYLGAFRKQTFTS